MRTIWMHGMGGSPDKEKMTVMRDMGLEPYALHLDYTSELQSFEILRDYCMAHDIAFLTGESLGGFWAFWLSEDLGLPCLLLNPAVSLRLKTKTKPNIRQLNSKLCMVALGDQDEQIDHKRTLMFMDKDRRNDKTILTKVIAGEGHEFSLQAFEAILCWGLDHLIDLGYLSIQRH